MYISTMDIEVRKQKEVYEIGVFELTIINDKSENHPIRVEIPKTMNVKQAEELIFCMHFAIQGVLGIEPEKC